MSFGRAPCRGHREVLRRVRMVHGGGSGWDARGEMGTHVAPSSCAEAHGPPRAGKRAGRPRRGAAHEPRQRAAHEDQWAQLQEPGECEMPGGLPSPCAPNPDLPPRLWASRKVRGGRSGQLPGQVPPDAFRAPAGPAFRTPAGPAATTDTGGDRSSLCIAMLSSACHLHPPPETPPP